MFTDGSVDFDDAQSSSPLPTSAFSAGFSGVVFVACGKELLFLGAFWSPSLSAVQAELAAVAGTLKLFDNTLARQRVGLTIHADCMFAIFATIGLCSSKASMSLLTFWQTWPARVLHLISSSEWPHRRLDLTLPVSDDLVAERFWTLVERCHDAMCSRFFVSLARTRVTIVTANVLTMHPAQVPDSDPSLFSYAQTSAFNLF